MFRIKQVKGRSRQGQGVNPIIALVVAPILVARRQSIVWSDLKVEPLAYVRAGPRVWKRAAKLRDLQRRGVHKRRVHDRKVIEISAFDVEKKRCLFAQRAAQTPVVMRRIVVRRRSGAFKRVLGIETRGIPHHRKHPMQLVRSWLGQNLHAAVT